VPGALAAASLSSCPCSLAGSIAGLEPESEIRLSSPNRSFSHTSSSGPSPGGYMVECWQCSWSERGGGEGYVTEKICLQRKLLFAHEIILTSQFCSVSFFWGGAHQPPQSDFAGKITWGKKFLMGNYSYLALLLKFGRINRLVLSAYPTTICVATSLHATLDSPL